MLHFIGFLQFIIGLIVFALSLALGLDNDEGFPGWPMAIILLLVAGILSVVIVILAHCLFVGYTSPIALAAFLHFVAFGFDLAAFVVALTYPPYTGCGDSEYKGCEMLKAAIGLDAVLWILFLVSSVILCFDSGLYLGRGTPYAVTARQPRYYY